MGSKYIRPAAHHSCGVLKMYPASPQIKANNASASSLLCCFRSPLKYRSSDRHSLHIRKGKFLLSAFLFFLCPQKTFSSSPSRHFPLVCRIKRNLLPRRLSPKTRFQKLQTGNVSGRPFCRKQPHYHALLKRKITLAASQISLGHYFSKKQNKKPFLYQYGCSPSSSHLRTTSSSKTV